MKVVKSLTSNLGKYITSILCALLGIFIIVIASNFSGETALDNIKTTQGHFIKYYEEGTGGNRSTKIIRYICMDDGKKYEINSITYQAFDKERFLNKVKTNDVLRLSYYTSINLHSEASYKLLSVDLGSENFMDLLKSQNARHNNQMVGIVLGSMFLLCGLLLIILLIFRKI